ncbi:hypothetical protein AVW11_24075 [Streptomyces amritsarensis]|uniref:Uncharacterized protein n=1 Tax=Streptomyces amritsarensis TaxID=681158 RepID=A0ABX3FXZ1_9ACTN|nr:hypothetical protein [Streptomyces amritsarensis]OLZ62010.1 hypothetical protein AVW11_24075 [Streptomyces amritsarensis]
MITAQRQPSDLLKAPASSVQPGQSPAGQGRRDFIYFWPIYTGQTLPMNSWRGRMRLDTWV